VQQRDDLLRVGGLVRLDVAAHQLPLGGVAPARRPVEPPAGPSPAQRLPRPLQCAVRRCDPDPEQPGRLGGGEREHVAQHEHGPLPRRQQPDRGHERQRHRLPADRHRLGLGRVVEEVVRVRLQARLMPPQRVQAGVGGDPVQPRARARALLERLAPPPRAQEHLLDVLLGQVHRAEHPVAVHQQLPAVPPGELRERVGVHHHCHTGTDADFLENHR